MTVRDLREQLDSAFIDDPVQIKVRLPKALLKESIVEALGDLETIPYNLTEDMIREIAGTVMDSIQEVMRTQMDLVGVGKRTVPRFHTVLEGRYEFDK